MTTDATNDTPRTCYRCNYGSGPAEVVAKHDEHVEAKRRELERANRYGTMQQIAACSVKGIKRGPKPPKRDQAIQESLSAQFRAGEIFSYSWDDGTWITWDTEADWLATERREVMALGPGVKPREPSIYTPVPAEGYGPRTWDRAELLAHLGLVSDRKPLSKTQLVAGLRKIADRLPPEALELLEAS